MKTSELIAEATSLPVEERAMVADCILRSLNPPDPVIEAKWAAVAKRRMAELRSGQAQPVPANEVFAKIWQRFPA